MSCCPPGASQGRAADTGHPACADNFTVITGVHEYIETAARARWLGTLLLDSFPETGTQVSLFMSVLRQVAPQCAVRAVELTADPVLLPARACARLACRQCESGLPDPVQHTAVPALAGAGRCGRCRKPLHRARGPLPASYPDRSGRYLLLAGGIRQAFSAAGVRTARFDTSSGLDESEAGLRALVSVPREPRHAP